jgi:hypothetical protein
MGFKMTPSLREHFNYRGVSAEAGRRGYGSSRPKLAWAIRYKQDEPEKPPNDQSESLNLTSPNDPDSN